jgi:hypothetical protein
MGKKKKKSSLLRPFRVLVFLRIPRPEFRCVIILTCQSINLKYIDPILFYFYWIKTLNIDPLCIGIEWIHQIYTLWFLSKKEGRVPTSRMNKVKSFRNRCMKIKHCSWKLYYHKRFFRPIDEAQNDFTVFFLWQRWRGRAVILHERVISLHFFLKKKKKKKKKPRLYEKWQLSLLFFNTKKNFI